MDENEINKNLRSVSGYLGSFAINELESLKISHYPTFIIVNLDERGNEGTHWIALAMYLNDVYVCDSLGTLLPSNVFPDKLINFLYRITFRRKLHITRQLQSASSTSCGLYCIFFLKYFYKHSYRLPLKMFPQTFSWSTDGVRVIIIHWRYKLCA